MDLGSIGTKEFSSAGCANRNPVIEAAGWIAALWYVEGGRVTPVTVGVILCANIVSDSSGEGAVVGARSTDLGVWNSVI